MRYLLFLFAACLFVTTPSVWGQAVRAPKIFALEGGLVYGAPVTKVDSGAKGILGLGMRRGIWFQAPIAERWALRAGLNYARQRARYESPIGGDTTVFQEVLPGVILEIDTYYKGKVEGGFDLSYYQFPISVSYQMRNMSLDMGIYAAFLAGGDASGLLDVVVGDSFRVETDVPFDQSNYIRKWDAGLMLGCSYFFENGLFASAKAQFGLPDIFIDGTPDVPNPNRNLYFHVSIGYAFSVKPD